MTHEQQIAEAIDELKIADEDFALLPQEQAQLIVTQVEDRFVDGHNWIWWWEHFLHEDYVVYHHKDEACSSLSQLLPEQEAFVWFIVEPDGSAGLFSVYKARAKYIRPVYEECAFFEYYIVPQDLSWLVGENHHGSFICIGEPITTRMQEIVHNNPDEWHVAKKRSA